MKLYGTRDRIFEKLSSRDWLGEIFGVIGAVGGIFFTFPSIVKNAKEHRATDLAWMICGALLGSLIGAVFGMILSGLLRFWLLRYWIEIFMGELGGKSYKLTVLCRRGQNWGMKGEIENAIKDYTEAIRVDPRDFLAYVHRAAVLEKLQKFENALNDYNTAIEIDPKSVPVHNYVARLRATCPDDQFRNDKEAVEYAKKASELDDWKFYNILDAIAEQYARAGDYKNAIKWAEKSLEILPEEAKEGANERLELYRANKFY